MAYSTSNPPVLQTQGGLDGSLPRRWVHSSTDTSTEIITTGYYTDGYNRGMAVNDVLQYVKSDGTTLPVTSHRITAVSTTGVTVSAGTTVGVV